MQLKIFVAVMLAVTASSPARGQMEPWFQKTVVSDEEALVRWIAAEDLDGDGDLDLATACEAGDRVVWFQNSAGVFTLKQVVSTAVDVASCVLAADLDGDGDIDLASASVNDNKLAWYPNTDGQGLFGSQLVVTNTVGKPYFVTSGDFDGDGYVDLVIASLNSEIAWYRNVDGLGSFTTEHVLTTSVLVAYAAIPADIDGDGDVDLVAASRDDDKVGWYENTDGSGIFGSETVITTDADGVRGVSAADIDGDGDIDVLSASAGDDKVAWYPNTDGVGSFGSQVIITQALDGPYVAIPVDVDLDGDLDIVSAGRVGGNIAWLENVDGLGNFGEPVTVMTGLDPIHVAPASLVSDGALDFAVASITFDEVVLVSFSAPDGQSGLVTAPQNRLAIDTVSEVVITFPTYPAADPFVWTHLTRTLVPFVSVVTGTTPVNRSVSLLAPGDALRNGDTLSFFAVARFLPLGALPHIVSVGMNGISLSGSPSVFVVDFECSPGNFVGVLSCEPCPLNTYSNSTTASSCSDCPSQMSSPRASSSFLDCVCREGSWFGVNRADREEGASCVGCPVGAVCPGGNLYPVSDVGFFQSPQRPFTFHSCLRRGCAGNNTCEAGYDASSFMCSACAVGYFSEDARTCSKCSPSASGLFALLVLGVLFGSALVSIYFSWSASKVAKLEAGAESGQAHILAFRARTVPVSLSLIVTAFQLVAIFSEAAYGWSSTSKAALSIFNIASINIQSFGSECALDSFHATYAMSIVVPFVCLVLVIFFLLLIRCVAPYFAFIRNIGDVSISTSVDLVIFTVAPVVYIPISRSTFILFDCVRLPNGDIVVEMDNGVACFDGDWWAVFPIGLLSMLVYVLGVPIYFGFTLWVNRHNLFSPETTSRYGPLYRNWRRAYYHGEILNLCKRLVIVSAATFLSRHQYAQILVITGVLCTALVTVARFQPFYFPFYNGVETRLTACVVAIFLLGVTSYSQETRLSKSTNAFLSFCVVAVVIALFIVSIHALAFDIFSLQRERNDSTVAARHRQRLFMQQVGTELKDVEAGPEVLHAAGEFLAVLDSASRGVVESRRRSHTFVTAGDDVPLDDIN